MKINLDDDAFVIYLLLGSIVVGMVVMSMMM